MKNKLLKITKALHFSLLTFSLLTACSLFEDPVFEGHELSLTVDAEVIETWITLTTDKRKKDAVYTVMRDTVTIFESKLDRNDTLLHDENLKPSTTYSYKAFAGLDGEKSKAVTASATTMDTTSHDFSWEVFEFGTKSSSILFDVAIINENDIWAVGEIHNEDTDRWNEDSTEWLPPYNVIHWNGVEWEFIRLMFNCRLYWPTCGPGTDLFSEAKSIIAFSPNDIWISAGTLQHFDGNNWIQYAGIQGVGYANKIWGSSRDDMYFVGNNGFIAHYDGVSWTKIESGTDENIQDIWGSYDEYSGRDFILCAASQIYRQSDKMILKINNDNKVSRYYWPYQDRRPYSVWFKNERKIFLSGSYAMTRAGQDEWVINDSSIIYFTYKIRGSELNNVFTVGGYGFITHFNGKTWREIPSFFDGNYISIDVASDLAVAVGYTSRLARLIIITPQN